MAVTSDISRQMTTYKTVLLLAFAIFAYFMARLSNVVNQQVLHLALILLLSGYIPGLRFKSVLPRVTENTLRPSRRLLLGGFVVLCIFVLLYNNLSGGWITNRLDPASILFICYLIFTSAAGFGDEEHRSALIVVFILATSYYFVGSAAAAETAGALLYFVLGFNVLRHFTKEMRHT